MKSGIRCPSEQAKPVKQHAVMPRGNFVGRAELNGGFRCLRGGDCVCRHIFVIRKCGKRAPSSGSMGLLVECVGPPIMTFFQKTRPSSAWD